jgi:prepilin-type N-terminal cleavage/methylation domain-containing protein
MNRTPRNQQRGFTLAEILVTTAIFAIIMIAALAIYDKSNKVFKSGTESADLQQSTRIGFDKLVADLRMAGFDYNRGGNPTGAGQFPQPDEQIEYAGKSAIVFRANFNYNTSSSAGNGLEPAYTPLDPSTGAPIFPFVTTSNDEVVAYVLRSADSTKNTGSISFYADASKPRSAYPGGSAESLVKISSALCATCGIDTTNANPPYTLYRMTLSDIQKGLPGTPVSENVRSLNFFYYTDPNGALTKELKNADGTVIASTRDADGTTSTPATATFTNEDGTTTTYNTGAIGGAGQYDPASPGTAANFTDRAARATIQSVRVNLIGMNANPENGYSQKTETITGIKSYRQYSLSALVVPRNLGLTGFPEPSSAFPAPPTITGICAAACAAPVICWTPPTGGGPVEQYRIEWDSNQSGAYANYMIVTDPSATKAVILDTGLIDPSITWYYHIYAQNENGLSLTPSNRVSVQPKNSTKPMPPAAASITASNPTNYAVTLGWTSPSTNDPAKASVNCTGANCSTDPTVIPSQELIHYRVFRGLTANFDPATAGQAVQVLGTGSASQPAVGAPGSPTAWNDSPGKSAFPPGTCVQYYYRVQAADRCVLNNALTASNDLNDSLSALSPPVGQTAIAGMAADLSTAQAVAPLSFKVNTASSACPAPLSTNCKIDLTWLKSSADTAGNAIGVDRYRLKRYRKKQTDPSFVLDTLFNGTGSLDVKGFSQSNAGTIGYSDLTAVAIDTSDGKPWYYEYTVAANDCRLGQVSAPADFPTPCAVNPVIVQSGASNGSDNADTPATAWIMNAGDSISVSAPAGLTITKVTFDVTVYPSGAAVESVIDSAAPFVYTWSDRSDSQIYQVKITVLTSTGCTEVHVKYVQDQQAAPCSFANQPLTAFSSATAGSTTTLSETYTITNTGTDPMQVASKPIKVTWAIPAGDTAHSDMTLNSIAYTTTTDNFTGAAPGTVTRSVPSSIANIPAGGTLNITVRWQYKKTDDPPALTGQPLSKICLDYAIASEPGVTKHCNLVGQSASTSNPNSCD